MYKRSYYGLTATITLSSLGDVFGLLALEWLVYELTASKITMGAMALCFSIPEITLRLLGSPLSDKLNRGRFMAGLSIVRLTALLVPLGFGLAGRLQLWHLFVAAGISGACSALFMPTAMAVVPAVADKHKWVRAFAVIDGFRNGAALIGPALAGALTANAGALSTLGINVLCYIMAIMPLRLLVPSMPKPAKINGVFSIRSYMKEIGDGFSFYRRFPSMFWIMALAAVGNMSSIAIWTMMVPFVREVLHRNAAAVGVLTTASALGTLAGLACITWIGNFKKSRVVMLCSLAATGLFSALPGLYPSYPFAIAALFAAGAAAPFFSSLSSSLHARLVPEPLQGRVNSIRFLIGGGLQPIGIFAGTVVAELFGLPFLFLSFGLLPFICSIIAACLPSLSNLDRIVPEEANKPNKLFV